MQQSAEASRTGQQMVAMKSGDIKAALTALADIDDGANKILDINSMMTALDDYPGGLLKEPLVFPSTTTSGTSPRIC